MLLLDQRGTGRSAPVNRRTLARLGPQAQADRLTHFRADSIVLDAELIRRELTDEPWSVLGQSFGGMCTVTYLSFAPHGIREALITAGCPGSPRRPTTSTGALTAPWPPRTPRTTSGIPRTWTRPVLVDDQNLTGVAGGTVLTPPGWATATSRFDIDATSGFSRLTVRRWYPPGS